MSSKKKEFETIVKDHLAALAQVFDEHGININNDDFSFLFKMIDEWDEAEDEQEEMEEDANDQCESGKAI